MSGTTEPNLSRPPLLVSLFATVAMFHVEQDFAPAARTPSGAASTRGRRGTWTISTSITSRARGRDRVIGRSSGMADAESGKGKGELGLTVLDCRSTMKGTKGEGITSCELQRGCGVRQGAQNLRTTPSGRCQIMALLAGQWQRPNTNAPVSIIDVSLSSAENAFPNRVSTSETVSSL